MPARRLEVALPIDKELGSQRAEDRAVEARREAEMPSEQSDTKSLRSETFYPILLGLNDGDRAEFMCLSLDGKYQLPPSISRAMLQFALNGDIKANKPRVVRKRGLTKGTTN